MSIILSGGANLSGFTTLGYLVSNVVIGDTTTGLKIYLNFDYAVSSTGGIYSSGVIYVPNLAPDANNTSDTTGSLFKSLSITDASLNTIDKKWGTASFSNRLSLLRNSLSYTFPQNTGLTFSIWANYSSSGYSFSQLFAFADSTSNNQVCLRLKCKSGTTPPWTLNYQVDDNLNANSPGVDVSPVQTINAGTWNHYAWVISPATYETTTTHTFYINGVSVATGSYKYPKSNARIFNDIAAQANAGYTRGYGDTFRYYERALSSTEISNIYNIADPANTIGITSLNGPFTTSSLNIISWYNPDYFTGTTTNVTGLNDILGINNLTKSGSGSLTIIKHNQYNLLSTAYSTPGTSTVGVPTLRLNSTTKVSSYGGVLFGYNQTNNNFQGNSLSEIFGISSDIGVRMLYSSSGTVTMNTNDLNYGGKTYLNGSLISSGSNNEILTGLPTALSTNYNIQYVGFSSTNYSTITTINLLLYTGRAFFGYLSDFFIVNTSFTDANRQVLEGYIAYKLGRQSILPTNHPYYSATNNIPVTIIPTSPIIVFTYTGVDQIITIPSGYTKAFIECWGAGGATQGYGNNSVYNTGAGGGGGYTSATFTITGYTRLKVMVGQGGQTRNFGGTLGNTYGGGAGQSTDSNWGLASGGGRSAVQLNTSGSTYVEIITSGGGGAAGSQYNTTGLTTPNIVNGGAGGGGGGLVGGNAFSSTNEGGKGGNTTTTSGGAGGTGSLTGTAGTQFQGGAGSAYASGGGGGYYGGGGGAYLTVSGGALFGGGGGGSSYVNSTYQTSGTTPTILQASSPTVANNSSLPSTYQNAIGNGAPATGLINTSAAGQNGIIVITYSN